MEMLDNVTPIGAIRPLGARSRDLVRFQPCLFSDRSPCEHLGLSPGNLEGWMPPARKSKVSPYFLAIEKLHALWLSFGEHPAVPVGSMGPGQFDGREKVGDNKIMRYMALIALSWVMCCAGQTRKPVCNASNHGQFWPVEANTSHDALRELYQRGELEMCSLVVWRHRWEHISVNVHDLAKGRHPLTSSQVEQAPKKADAAAGSLWRASQSR